jgi:iron-sulfur cluster repair protein YtfE (RIC family)
MLIEDHQRMRDLFFQCETMQEPEARWTIAEQLFVTLDMHTQLEEQIFYRAVAEEMGGEAARMVLKSRREHQAMQDLAQALRQRGPHDARFTEQFTELLRQVEHHAEEEETQLFPLVEEEFADVIEELGEEMQALKERLRHV